MSICKCGCGGNCKNFFINHHNVRAFSNETRRKISVGNTGKIRSDETKEKLRISSSNRKVSEETKMKISKAAKGRSISIETREKIRKKLIGRIGLRGRIFSKETKNKMAIAAKNRKIHGHTGFKHSEITKDIIRKKVTGNKNNLGKYRIGKPWTEEQKERVRGINSHSWKGGASLTRYDRKFDKRFKSQIRNRDDNTCQVCLLNKSKSLDVHHIDYNKKNSVIENCIALCKKCHMKTNHNRETWNTFFNFLLFEKYNYDNKKTEVKN